MTELKRTHKGEVNEQKLYIAKTLALARINGDHDGAYKKMHKYGHMLRLMNPEIMVSVKCERLVTLGNPTFQRFFFCPSLPKSQSISIDTCYLLT